MLRIVPPFGVASTSCCSAVAADGFERQVADGCDARSFGVTFPLSVSCTMVCPPPLAPIARVPTERKVSPSRVKKSRSVCGLPVGIVVTNSHAAFAPPACAVCAGGVPEGPSLGGAWSNSVCAATEAGSTRPATIAMSRTVRRGMRP